MTADDESTTRTEMFCVIVVGTCRCPLRCRRVGVAAAVAVAIAGAEARAAAEAA